MKITTSIRTTFYLILLSFFMPFLLEGQNSPQLIKDIANQSNSSTPTTLIPVGNEFLFFAETPTTGYELYKTDGTSGNAQLVKEINVGPGSAVEVGGDGKLESFAVAGNKLYFFAQDNTDQVELWSSDGTATGTQPISSNWSNPYLRTFNPLVSLNDEIFFVGSFDNDVGLYKVPTGNDQPYLIHTNIAYDLVATGDKIYFYVYIPVDPTNPFTTSRITLAESDGTVAGTQLLGTIGTSGGGCSFGVNLSTLNDKLFYYTLSFCQGSNALVYDGELIYSMIPAFGFITTPPVSSAGRLFFAGPNPDNQPGLSENLYKRENGNNSLIKTFPDGPLPSKLTDLDGTLFFVAEDGINGLELWKSDGTEAGTVLVKDLNAGSEGSDPKNLISINGKLYFSANDGSGIAIWESDGSEIGTQKVGNFPNGDNSNLKDFTASGNSILFSGNDGQIGQELWKMDLIANPNTGPDVELVINASVLSPPIYTNTTFTLDLTNTGDSPMTGVTIDFPVPSGLAFVSQNIGTGTYSNWNGIWNVGSLAAGETATMDLTLFTLTAAPLPVYAQVATHNETDTDSSPGNGTPPTPNEDDEAQVTLNDSNPPDCEITGFGLIVGDCQSNGTPDPADDYFTFSVMPTGTNLGNTYDIFLNSSGGSSSGNDVSYNVQFYPINQLISGGVVDVEIVDASGVCMGNFSVAPPAPCSVASNPELAISIVGNDPFITYAGVSFNYELFSENLGTGGPASFNIGTYLSEDNQLSSDDQQLSSITYTLTAGASEILTPSINFATDLAPGIFYLIFKTDDNDGYAESDENNNITSRQIQIWSSTPLECENFIAGVDEVFCSSQNGDGNYEVITRFEDNYNQFTIDENGVQVGPGILAIYNEDRVDIIDDKIEKKDRNGGLIYSIDIPAAIVNSYDLLKDADELIGGSTGYVISAQNAGGPYAVFLDENLNFISEVALTDYFPGPVVATEDGGAMIGAFQHYPTHPQGTPLNSKVFKVSAGHTLEYEFPISGYVINAKRLPCGNSQVRFEGIRSVGHGGFSAQETYRHDVEDRGNSTYKVLSFQRNGYSFTSPVSQFYDYKTWYQEDGSYFTYSNFTSPPVPSVGWLGDEYRTLEKFDINDISQYSKDLDPDAFLFASHFTLAELDNGKVIFIGKKYDRLWYYQPNCNDAPPATCEDNLLTNPGYESSSVFSSGWYDLGGTSITTDANSGDHALLISGNATGGILQNLPATAGETYTLRAQVKRTSASNEGTGNYISLKFLSASWQPLETLVDIVPAGNTFEEYGRSFTAPAGTAYVEAKAFKDNGGFEMIVDDWCLTQEGGTPCDNDNVPPVFTSCPDDITVYTTGNSAPVNWTPPTVTDNCGIESVTGLPYQPGDDFLVGNYSLGVTAFDLAGNSSNCTFLISVIHQTADQPDLTLSDLNNVPANATIGSVINYDFDLQNIDAGDASGTFNIRTYFSTDQVLSSDDVHDGLIPSGYLGGNSTIGDIPGASTVPSSLTPGNYYLLIYVDADSDIAESNENNNVLVSTTTISIEQDGCPGNLVQNPGFENGLDGWLVPTGTYQLTNDARSGQQALALSKDATLNWGFVTQTIPVNPNKRYEVEVYMQVPGQGQSIVAQAYDNNQAPMGQISQAGDISAGPGYSALSLIYDTKPGATTLDLRIVTVSSGFTEIDDVCITETEILDGNDPDLELSISSDISTIDAWQSFSMTVTLENKGSEAATNVVVDFPEPAGVVFQGGNEYTASQGTYNSYDPQEWLVGGLGAGETATITFNLFSTQDSNPVTGYAQVLSMDQSDADSSPGNGTCCTPNEDDEAVVVIPTAGPSPNTRQSANGTTDFMELNTLFPNPSIQQINLVITSPFNQNSILQIYDLKGSLIDHKTIPLQKGVNQIQMEIGELQAGMYQILLVDGHQKKNRLRFIKIEN